MSIIDNFKKIIQKKDIFESVESIMSIPIPKYPKLEGLTSPVNNIEYILQRKATEFKKQGDMDRAIACLKRSNQIMPYSNFSYQAKDYERLIKYLRLAGRNEEADFEEKALHSQHPELYDMSVGNKKRYEEIVEKYKRLKAKGILISTSNNCPICGKYNRKTYSLSKIPSELKSGNLKCNHIVGYNLTFK